MSDSTQNAPPNADDTQVAYARAAAGKSATTESTNTAELHIRAEPTGGADAADKVSLQKQYSMSQNSWCDCTMRVPCIQRHRK